MELGAVALEAADLPAEAARSAGAQLDLDVEECWVRADELEARQVAVNLLDNALRYGGKRVRLTVNAAGIAVHDAGRGPRPDEWARLLRPFERGAASPRHARQQARPRARRDPRGALGRAAVARVVARRPRGPRALDRTRRGQCRPDSVGAPRHPGGGRPPRRKKSARRASRCSGAVMTSLGAQEERPGKANQMSAALDGVAAWRAAGTANLTGLGEITR